jgi:signal recognition particle subunit SRP54
MEAMQKELEGMDPNALPSELRERVLGGGRSSAPTQMPQVPDLDQLMKNLPKGLPGLGGGLPGLGGGSPFKGLPGLGKKK